MSDMKKSSEAAARCQVSKPVGFDKLKDFISHIEDGSPLSRETACWVATAFKQIIAGADAKRALQLVPPAKLPGRPPGMGRWGDWMASSAGKATTHLVEVTVAGSVIGEDGKIFTSPAVSRQVTRDLKMEYRRANPRRDRRKAEPFLRTALSLKQWREVTSRYLTELELDALDYEDAGTVLRIAQARRVSPELTLEELRELVAEEKADK